MATFDESGNGGIEVSGLAELSVVYLFVGSGGVIGSGSGTSSKIININTSGGVIGSGSGSSSKIISINASGGSIVSGTSSVTHITNPLTGGGVITSGDSEDQTTYFIQGSGGALGSGSSFSNKIVNVTGSGGSLGSGSAVAVRIVPVFASGGAIGSGAGSVFVIYNPSTTGGVVVSGDSTDRILVNSSFTLPILFDLGELPLYAYRLIGKCSPLDCTQIPINDPNNTTCNNRTIQYILARNLSEICTQLASYDFIFRVEVVLRYNRAIFGFDYLNDVRNDLVNPNCPNFDDVTDDFCKEAQCFDFCIENNTMFIAKANFQGDFYNPFEATGDIKLTGSYTVNTVFAYYATSGSGNQLVGGNAAASGVNLLPTLTYIGSGFIGAEPNSSINNSYLGEYTQTVSSNFDNESLTINLNGPNGLQLFGEEVNRVSNICGCNRLLNYIDLETNLFTKTSIFSNFLYRNKLSPYKTNRLYYNQATKTFYNSFKFDGLGSLAGETESWNTVFELACTNQVTLTNISLWNFSFFIQRKVYKNNVLTNNLETRFYVYIPSTFIYNNSSLLQFDFQIDMKNLVVYRRFKDIIFDLQPKIVKDNIKIFSSGDWIADPFMEIYVFSLKTDYSQIFRPNRNSRKINILPLLDSP